MEIDSSPVEPTNLLSTLPPEIFGLVTQWLSEADFLRLIQVGNLQLARKLSFPGSVPALRCRNPRSLESFLSFFPNVSFLDTTLSIPGHLIPTMPSTLTRLNFWPPSSESRNDFEISIQLIEDLNDFEFSLLFPCLRKLSIPMNLDRRMHHWVARLPKTLESLIVGSITDCGPLPPNLTTITASTQMKLPVFAPVLEHLVNVHLEMALSTEENEAFSDSAIFLDSLLSTLESLHIRGICWSMENTQLEHLPLHLTDLRLESAENATVFHSDLDWKLGFLKRLNTLHIDRIPEPRVTDFLPTTLTDLEILTFHFPVNSVVLPFLDSLPRGLIRFCIKGRNHIVDRKLNWPKSLKTLSAPILRFRSSAIPGLPTSLTFLQLNLALWVNSNRGHTIHSLETTQTQKALRSFMRRGVELHQALGKHLKELPISGGSVC
jgi:hypothetical protein